MKKFPSILFVFSLLFMLTACSSSADPSQESSGQTTSPSSQQDSVSVSNAVLESESTESEQSANNTLIVYFSRWGNTEYPSDVDAITSASIVVDNNSRYGTTEYPYDPFFQSGSMYYCEEKGMGIVTMRSLTSGIFQKWMRIIQPDNTFDYSKALIQYVLSNPLVDTALLGMRSVAQVEENVAVCLDTAHRIDLAELHKRKVD